ncbi:MAG: cellulase family glycosylhydrolase [Anaerolineae bacterium]|nr:cellulase family glycosylhydrolase [Anaerolineae bacterium]
MSKQQPERISWLTVSRLQKAGLLGVIAVMMIVVAFGVRRWSNDDQGAFFSPSPTPPIPRDLAPDAIVDPPFTSLTYGIHTFLWWNETTRTYDLDMVRLMNFTHVKQTFSWIDIEPVQGEWHWDRADNVVDEIAYRGLNLVARLDSAPSWAVAPPGGDVTTPPVDLDAWATFCGAVAGRYPGRIAAYQVWNEPNLNREWGGHPPNAAGYVKLLKTCTQAIREADPNAVVISAGLAPTGTQLPDAIPDIDYLRQLYAADWSPWFDVLGFNAPGYAAAPTVSPDEAAAQYGHRWMAFRHVEDIRGIMVEQGDAAKQIALLEIGWTTDQREGSPYLWHAVTEEQQAEYLVGAYRYAAEHWRPWVGLVVTIYMADYFWTPDDEEYWWAVDLPGYPPRDIRPAYIALANMEKVMGDTIIPERLPGVPEAVEVEPIAPREGAE